MKEIIVFARKDNPGLEDLINGLEQRAKQWIFLKNPFPKSPAAGLRFKIADEKNWVFHSTVYQENIPYSQIATGKEVIILKNRRDQEGLKGIIANRYFERPDLEELREQMVPMNLNEGNIYHPEMSLTKTSFDVLSKGRVSRDMDDRWHILPDGETFHVLRSWPAIEIYRASFKVDTSEMYQLRELIVNKEWTLTQEEAIGNFQGVLNQHARWYQKIVDE
jgi:hypothetical protein